MIFCVQTKDKTNTFVEPRLCVDDYKERVVLYIDLNQSYTLTEQRMTNDEIIKNNYKVVKTFVIRPNTHTVGIVDACEYCEKHKIDIIVIPSLSHLGDTNNVFASVIAYMLSAYPNIRLHSALCGCLIPKAKWCDDYILLKSLYDAESNKN